MIWSRCLARRQKTTPGRNASTDASAGGCATNTRTSLGENPNEKKNVSTVLERKKVSFHGSSVVASVFPRNIDGASGSRRQ